MVKELELPRATGRLRRREQFERKFVKWGHIKISNNVQDLNDGISLLHCSTLGLWPCSGLDFCTGAMPCVQPGTNVPLIKHKNPSREHCFSSFFLLQPQHSVSVPCFAYSFILWSHWLFLSWACNGSAIRVSVLKNHERKNTCNNTVLK